MHMTGYCGIDCERCGNYLKNANCLGCRVDQEMICDCDIRDCCKRQNIDFCGQCRDFPCEKMQQFYSGKPQYSYAKDAMAEMSKRIDEE